MWVRFLQDYRGKLTAEAFFEKDDVVELPDGPAQQLVEAGRAEAAAKPKKTKKEADHGTTA